MKFMDYGKMAATFVNLATGKAVRVVAREDSKAKAKTYFPEIEDKYRCQLEAYKRMPAAELFSRQWVRVEIADEDMPGRPLSRVQCQRCGEHVQDRREVCENGKILCRPCADGGYWSASSFLRHPVMHNSHNAINQYTSRAELS
jgi:formylmethanofuran dehydrogenase subunit E